MRSDSRAPTNRNLKIVDEEDKDESSYRSDNDAGKLESLVSDDYDWKKKACKPSLIRLPKRSPPQLKSPATNAFLSPEKRDSVESWVYEYIEKREI